VREADSLESVLLPGRQRAPAGADALVATNPRGAGKAL